MRSFCVICGRDYIVPRGSDGRPEVPVICPVCKKGGTEMMADSEKYLIKCSCETCDCPSATVDGVCFECSRGLHVTHYQDGEVKRAQAKEPCELCGLYPCDCARDV